MKMLSAGTGVGMGVKDYRLIFVFQKKSALDTFVKLFQLTESGVALQSTLQGTKYWNDEDLN